MSVISGISNGDAGPSALDQQQQAVTVNNAKAQRSSRLFSAPPSLSAGALASLARAPLMRMDAEANVSNVSLPNRQSTSDNNTPQGESSNSVLGPNGTLVPRSSILLNPSGKATFIEQWRPKLEDEAVRAAPAVLKIPAAPTAKDREKQRERERIEREREIEREVREKEQAEKVWGIPKKAFYLGMGEINFNAQMAMLGGWGNGSADMGPIQAPSRRKSLPNRSKSKKARPDSKAGRSSVQSTTKKRPSSASGPPPAPAPAKVDDGADSDASSIDLEELAALNAIINTRRSMEAAQALAGGLVSRPVPPLVRTAATMDKVGNADRVLVATDTNIDGTVADEELSNALMVDPEPRKIKFAPLPMAYSSAAPILSALQGGEDGEVDDIPLSASYEDSEKVFLDDDESDSGEEDMFDGDEGDARRWTSGKGGKWYMMGMPKNVFSSQYYRSLQRRPGGPEAVPAVGTELSSSPASERKLQAQSTDVAQVGERRGRRPRRTTSSRASSVKSRSSSVGSIEDDERERRRQLLRASRPGGTGMLTLPDGTKIRARRVGERYSDNEDEEGQVPGRASIGTDAEDIQTGDKRASDDEGGRESDSQTADGPSSMVKRRRRSAELPADEEVVPLPASQSNLAEEVDKAAVEEVVPARKPPKRSVTMPAGPVPLSATQAAEVRRRHEEEVGALAAEVLQNIAKAKKAKQQQEQEQQAQKDAKHGQNIGKSANVQQSHQAGKHDKANAANLAQQIASDTVTTADRGRLKDRVKRSFTTDDSRHRKNNADVMQRNASRDDSAVRKDRVTAIAPVATTTNIYQPSTPTRKLSTLYTGGTAMSNVSSPIAGDMVNSTPDLTDSVTSVRTLRAGEAISALSIRTRNASPEADVNRVIGAAELPALGEAVASPPEQIVQSPTEVAKAESLASTSPASVAAIRHRLPDLPSPLDLPRRPDVRGYAVVPLPIKQLGRRPQKPREGNFWGDDAQLDTVDVVHAYPSEDDEEDDEEEERDPPSALDSRGGADSEDEDSDMDADQLAEEERRTAVQKKRATTRAAGAEIVSGLGPKHKSSAAPPKSARIERQRSAMADQLRTRPRSRSSTSLARSFIGSDGRISSEYTDGVRIGPKTSRSSQFSNGTIGASSSRTSDGGGSRTRPPLSTAVLSTARDRKGNPVVRLHRRPDTWNDFDSSDEDVAAAEYDGASAVLPPPDEEALDLSDGDDLWPPTLDNALGGVTPTSMTERTPTSAAGQGNYRPSTIHRLSSSSSVRSSMSASKHDSPSAARLAAHAAKSKMIREKREREAKERERQKALESNIAEDSLEYGWPKSLQGSSLY